MDVVLHGMTRYKPNRGNSKLLNDPRYPEHSVFLQIYSNNQIIGFRLYKDVIAARKKGPKVPRWWVLQYSSFLRETLWFRPLMMPIGFRKAPPGTSEDELYVPFGDPSSVLLPMMEQTPVPAGNPAGGTFAMICAFDREEALAFRDNRSSKKGLSGKLPLVGAKEPYPCMPPGTPGFSLWLPDHMEVWPTFVEAKPHEKGGHFLKPPSELIEPLTAYGSMRADEMPYHLYFDRMRNLIFVRQPLNKPDRT